MLMNAYFLNARKEAKVIPVSKPCKVATVIESYRPINLFSSIGKLYIINKHK